MDEGMWAIDGSNIEITQKQAGSTRNFTETTHPIDDPMAESMNPKLQGMRGAVGNQLVFKQYGDKTVVTKYPDMTGIVPSEVQKEKQACSEKPLPMLLPLPATRRRKQRINKRYRKARVCITVR